MVKNPCDYTKLTIKLNWREYTLCVAHKQANELAKMDFALYMWAYM